MADGPEERGPLRAGQRKGAVARVLGAVHGRVLGAVTFMALVSQPVGIPGTGVVFDQARPAWVFLTMALVPALAALFGLSPVMRGLPRPEEVAVA